MQWTSFDIIGELGFIKLEIEWNVRNEPIRKSTLLLDQYHLNFLNDQNENEHLLPYNSIDDASFIDPSYHNTSEDPANALSLTTAEQLRAISARCSEIRIYTKDFLIYRFFVKDKPRAYRLTKSIKQLSNLKIAYEFHQHNRNALADSISNQTLERDVIDLMRDQSMAVYLQGALDTTSWRITSINHDFSTSPSYDCRGLIVPASLTDDIIRASSKFRDQSRFPVLCYLHWANQSCLARCSQPLVGRDLSNQNRADEQNLAAFQRADSNFQYYYIFDTRSDAALNGGGGGGGGNINIQNSKISFSASASSYSSSSSSLTHSSGSSGGLEQNRFYKQWRVSLLNLERPEAIDSAFTKLIEGCLGMDQSATHKKWTNALASWLCMVHDLIWAARRIAVLMHEKCNCVVVHGDKGMDVTLQVTALVQLLLNPQCRTIHGFIGLIDREFIKAGHPFSLRCAKTSTKYSAGSASSSATSQSATNGAARKEESPVFLLFLDCVWQIWRQFPYAFQFNESLLLLLVRNCYFSKFSTFFGNCELERSTLNLGQLTLSLWYHVDRSQMLFINPMFNDAITAPHNCSPIWPNMAPFNYKLWEEAYTTQNGKVGRFEMWRNLVMQLGAELRQIESGAKCDSKTEHINSEKEERKANGDNLATSEESEGAEVAASFVSESQSESLHRVVTSPLE